MYNLAFVLEGEHFVIEIFLMVSSFFYKKYFMPFKVITLISKHC